ncbi:hypothetical protein B0H11DRAFT_2240898 [Mycena galericulata]|nr:hypothetical protein B0H11DRAFT_2240898 [Mycena galericulata]
MTTTAAPATTASTSSEMAALVALVARLSSATLDATRLAVEVQAKLPAVVVAEVAASAAATAAATSTEAAAAAAAAAAASPLLVRQAARTLTALEAAFPEGSGEVWYVVIIGRKPGMYRTAAEADSLCNGIPNQLKAKKTSRREALAWYRERYNQQDGNGVQKWVEVDV